MHDYAAQQGHKLYIKVSSAESCKPPQRHSNTFAPAESYLLNCHPLTPRSTQGQLRIPYAFAAFVRSFTAISCAVFACSIAVTNPFYLSALTRKQMSKRLPTAEARDASRARGLWCWPQRYGTLLSRHMCISVCQVGSMGGWYIARSQLERRPQNWKLRLACKQADVVAVEEMSQKQTKNPSKILRISNRGENPRNSCMEHIPCQATLSVAFGKGDALNPQRNETICVCGRDLFVQNWNWPGMFRCQFAILSLSPSRCCTASCYVPLAS